MTLEYCGLVSHLVAAACLVAILGARAPGPWRRWLGSTSLGLLLPGAVEAITLTPFGPAGEGGTRNGQTFRIGPGGTVFELDAFLHVENTVEPAFQLSQDPLPAGLRLEFSSELAPDGTDIVLSFAFTNETDRSFSDVTFLSFIDVEIDERTNTFVNEYVTVSGNLGAGVADELPDGFEVDEAGFVSGDLRAHLRQAVLDNQNTITADAPDCVSMALAFELGSIQAGETARVEVLISEDGTSLAPFALTHLDADPLSATAITYSGRVLGGLDPRSFRRGDLDGDGRPSAGDAQALLALLETGGPAPGGCDGEESEDIADANDNEWLTIADYLAVREAAAGQLRLPGPSRACGIDPDESQRGFDAVAPGFTVSAGDTRLGPPDRDGRRGLEFPILIRTAEEVTGLTLLLRFDDHSLTAPVLTTELGDSTTQASGDVLLIHLWAGTAGSALLPGGESGFVEAGTLSFTLEPNAIVRVLEWLPERPAGGRRLRASLVDGALQDRHPQLHAGEREFVRGNSNNDAEVNISDAVYTLGFLFLDQPDPACREAADANNDSGVNITDAIYTLNFLFLSGAKIPRPFPDCGLDEGAIDFLDCSAAESQCGE